MTKRTRRNHAPAFKAKVALSALKARDAGRVGSAVRCPSEPDHAWKGQLLEGAAGVLARRRPRPVRRGGLKALHAKIGELTVENDFLEGALTKSRHAERKAMIDRTHDLSISRQAKA